MLRFDYYFCLMTASKMLPQHLQTANEQLYLLKQETSSYDISKTCKDNDGCDEQYICVTALYLPPMLAHAYNIIIYRGIGSPINGRVVVDGLNRNYKRFISMLS